MGGLVGMLLAAMPQAPIRRLVISDEAGLHTQGRRSNGSPPTWAAIRTFVDAAKQRPTFGVSIEPFGPLTDDQWRHLARFGTRSAEGGRIALAYDPGIAEAFRSGIRDVDLWPVWKQVQCDVLITRGAKSDLLSAETAQTMIKQGPARGRLVEFAGVGHAPMFMSEDQMSVVESFLLAV
ncbi:MAG: alpha/beta hydrolase [Betaproteobacteria bacterium]|nr:alpha/beta hydrolase [Betaproteobacteria bacterium]